MLHVGCFRIYTLSWHSLTYLAFIKYAAVPSVANPSSTDPNGIASNIKYHADYSPSFTPYKFELKQAYVATAESLRDTLVERWNETYKHFTDENAKSIHYLSMEFLQVRYW